MKDHARLATAGVVGALLALVLTAAPGRRTEAQDAPKGSAALVGKKVVFAGAIGAEDTAGLVESVDSVGVWIHYEMGMKDARKPFAAFLPWSSVRWIRLAAQ